MSSPPNAKVLLAAVLAAVLAAGFFPLPGVFVDTVTGPFKQPIAAIVVEILYWVGYPISLNGVVLTIG